MILIIDVVVCKNEDSRDSFTVLRSKTNLDMISPRLFSSTALRGNCKILFAKSSALEWIVAIFVSDKFLITSSKKINFSLDFQ